MPSSSSVLLECLEFLNELLSDSQAYSVFLFVQISSSLMNYFVALMIIKSQVMDFYASEQQLRSIALDDDDVAAQELRNL